MKQSITPEDNLHAAESLIEDACSSRDHQEALDQLWNVATMIMGTDNPESGGCMNAKGCLGSLKLIAERMTERVKKIAPADRSEVQKHIDQIEHRIHDASDATDEVAAWQKAVRKSSGSFLAFKKTA